jgi:antitoxin ParD1/3/4
MATTSRATTLNISLPKPLKQFVDQQISLGAYGSASEFVREAIREKMRRQRAEAELAAKLLKGMNSGFIEVDEHFFERKKATLAKRLTHRKRSA